MIIFWVIILDDCCTRGEPMPRKNRSDIIFNGAVYHVYHRGNNSEFIFQNNKHKAFFLKELKEYHKKFSYELLAYAIMDNHYHMIVRTSETSISDIMFNVNNVMSKFLNRELKRTGHVFEGRYNCKLIESDSYLIWLLRYIHRNPIRANVCNDLNQYRWSSHYFYKNAISTEFVNTYFLLSMFSEDKKIALKSYLRLMDMQGNDQDSESDFVLIESSIGLKAGMTITIPTEATNKLPERESLESIFTSIFITQEFQNLIKSKSKNRKLTPLKLHFINQSLLNKYSLKEISQYLNTDESSISKLLSRHKNIL